MITRRHFSALAAAALVAPTAPAWAASGPLTVLTVASLAEPARALAQKLRAAGQGEAKIVITASADILARAAGEAVAVLLDDAEEALKQNWTASAVIGTDRLVWAMPSATSRAVRLIPGRPAAALDLLSETGVAVAVDPAQPGLGRRSAEAMMALGLTHALAERVVPVPGAAEALAMLKANQAEAAILPASLVSQIQGIEAAGLIPPATHQPFVQFAGVSVAATSPQAQAWIALVVGAEGKQIFARHGLAT